VRESELLDELDAVMARAQGSDLRGPLDLFAGLYGGSGALGGAA
jgi:hypothetical protein